MTPQAALLEAREAAERVAQSDEHTWAAAPPPPRHPPPPPLPPPQQQHVPPLMDEDVEVLLDAELGVALYAYNDVLLRIDEAVEGSRLDVVGLNAQRTYMQIDGKPALGPTFLQHAPRLFCYGSTEHYSLLHFGEALAATLEERSSLASAALFGLPECEMRRRVTLLRRRWPHEKRNQPLVPKSRDGLSITRHIRAPASIGTTADNNSETAERVLRSQLRAHRGLHAARAITRHAGRCYCGGEPLVSAADDTLAGLLGVPMAADDDAFEA